MAALIVCLVLFLASLPIIRLLNKRSGGPSKRLPPGSMGIPVIGQSLGLVNAMRANKAEKWLTCRIEKYGPVSKLSLFGRPTVFLSGPAANKFIFGSESLALQQPQSIQRIIGKRNMLELTGEDHKRVRGAVAQFLRPDMLKKYVAKIDWEVRLHLKNNWIGRDSVTVLPLMKRLTFDVICSVIFGLEKSVLRENLVTDFTDMVDGMLSVPINLPFTCFNKSLKASQRVRGALDRIIHKKKAAIEKGKCSNSQDDLITYLLAHVDVENKVTEEEIVHNAALVMIAGHDTSSILLTFMIRQLAIDPDIYSAVVHEQEKIAKGKSPGEDLEWEDLVKMKYTWRVAMETLRMIPPVFVGFRKVLKDTMFEGYDIPQGWQVLWATHQTHMDGDIFKEPERFNPSRFENQSSIPPYCFAAFGGGSRVCPGNEFAKIETLVAMHYLVTEFRWKLSLKDAAGYCRDPLPTPFQGLPIQLESKTTVPKI